MVEAWKQTRAVDEALLFPQIGQLSSRRAPDGLPASGVLWCWIMKHVIRLLLSAALIWIFSASWVLLKTQEAAAGSCYRVWAEARSNGSYFRHIVYVENDCEYWLECSLWTDSDPRATKMVTVGPEMTEQVETSGSSKDDDPKGFGACHRK